MSKIEIYTDGSCLGNPGPGGWAVLIRFDKKEITLFGGEKKTTNNRMEMLAIINALSWVRKKNLNDVKITIHSDSNLLVQTLTQNWKRKANLDLWAKLDSLRAWLDINWVWVKAHAQDKSNNFVDMLAQKEAQKQKKNSSI